MPSSYNGWPASPDPNAIGIDTKFSVCGTKPFASGGYPGGIKSGDVSKLFKYLIEALHTRVEPMMSEGSNLGYGCWGYSYRANVNNPSTLSCHASGTAIDYNAPKHPNGTSTGPSGGGGWSGSQYNQIQAILKNECSGAIRWLTSNDPMHFEIYGSTQSVANAAAKLSGGSGPTPTPEPVVKDDDGMTTSVEVNGKLNVFAVATDGKIYQQWPDSSKPGGWSGWIAGVPGTWFGGLSATVGADNGISIFGVGTDGVVCQVWSTPKGWQGPVPFSGIKVKV